MTSYALPQSLGLNSCSLYGSWLLK